jgi:hypothetical protein
MQAIRASTITQVKFWIFNLFLCYCLP